MSNEVEVYKKSDWLSKVEKSSPPFQSAYITSGLFKAKIIFDK